MIISLFIRKVFNKMILLWSFAAPLELEWLFNQCNAFVTLCHRSSRCNISQPAVFSVNIGIRHQWYQSLDGTTSLCIPGHNATPWKSSSDTRAQAPWIPVTQKNPTPNHQTVCSNPLQSKFWRKKFRIIPRQKEELGSEPPKRLHIKLTQDYCLQQGRWLLSLSSLSIHPSRRIHTNFAMELFLICISSATAGPVSHITS